MKSKKAAEDMPRRPSLFWDTDPMKVDPEKNARYVIERILFLGDLEDFRWAKDAYGEERIKEEVIRSRELDPKSQNFWCLYFNVDPKICTKKLSTLKQSPFWAR
ncbi:hypothetical protein L0Y69_03015 [bacterium]|nr:hypothetical protein [bacterium]